MAVRDAPTFPKGQYRRDSPGATLHPIGRVAGIDRPDCRDDASESENREDEVNRRSGRAQQRPAVQGGLGLATLAQDFLMFVLRPQRRRSCARGGQFIF
jgi:hypothetical protein